MLLYTQILNKKFPPLPHFFFKADDPEVVFFTVDLALGVVPPPDLCLAKPVEPLVVDFLTPGEEALFNGIVGFEAVFVVVVVCVLF